MSAFHECRVLLFTLSAVKKKPLHPDLKLARVSACCSLTGKLFRSTAPKAVYLNTRSSAMYAKKQQWLNNGLKASRELCLFS